MSRLWTIPLLFPLACAPRAAPPVASPTAETRTDSPTPAAVGEGESVETAVFVPAQRESEGVAWENEWIWSHYGRFLKKSVGLATAGGRRYDAVTVELADHSERTVYFDITDFLGKK